jgi:TIR domain-containing protein
MTQIFVSYRRADSAGSTGRLFDHLADHFGASQVFRDIDSIEAGENFEHAILGALAGATAALIVIGPRWLDARNADGSRRLDDPNDYVRREIETALASSTRVIPVLVEDARMPTPDTLPVSLRDLAKRNAVEVSDRHWRYDTRDLIEAIDRWVAPDRRPPRESLGRAAGDALSGFAPDLFSIIRGPREFLRRRTHGRRADLVTAIAFFVTAVVLGLLMLMSVYTPRESAASFFLAALAIGFAISILLSGPLWIGWGVVGARRHYSRVLIVALYQTAVLHLAIFVAAWVVIAALEWQSNNVVRKSIDEAMRDRSGAEAIRAAADVLLPLSQTGGVRLAIVAATAIVIAAAFWVVRSWGAYRDAFSLTRARSTVAVAVAALVGWIGLALANLVVSFGR